MTKQQDANDGRCVIHQETIYNPFDGQGLDLFCSVHDCTFNVPTTRGQTNVDQPVVCPMGAKNKLM